MIALRRLSIADVDGVAAVLGPAFAMALPRLAGRHTVDENRAFVRQHLFASNALWGVCDVDQLIGYVAFHPGWIDHLYVRPERVGQGFGTALLNVAKSCERRLDLWTFQANVRARRFYEARGFVEMERTDGTGTDGTGNNGTGNNGAGNDEREPDLRYRWSAAT